MVSLPMKRSVVSLIICSYEGTHDSGREDGSCFYSDEEKCSCATSKGAHYDFENEKWPRIQALNKSGAIFQCFMLEL